MFPKKNRSDKKAIAHIFKACAPKRPEGHSINSSHLTLKFILLAESTVPRISFIVPKTVSKNAVDRTLLRRRGYSVLEKYFKKLPPSIVGVFMFKKESMEIFSKKDNAMENLENEIKSILNKIN